jgi:two-component system sensor histidine kinase TctE
MNASTSLRLRLTLIILVPLLLIAGLAGYWQWRDARDQAADLFDKSLLITALAIAGDLARSSGDALSLKTRDLLSDTSGGPVYYHSYAPDGVYVTGFATRPVLQGAAKIDDQVTFYDSTYYGRPVRALRIRDVTTIEGLSGVFTYTVWQEVAVRSALLRDISLRAFTVMAVLIGTVAFVVWFGVRFGLRPLIELEDAIQRRSSDDLSPIRRAVPPETRGIVSRLNTLFTQVDAAMSAQASFISNAAHQLRNPIAGVLAMAEAVRSAPTEADLRSRAEELLQSARHAKDMANKLLTLERARAGDKLVEPTDLRALLLELDDAHRDRAHAAGVDLNIRLPDQPVILNADPVMMTEALSNLIDNALRHGGPDLSRISVCIAQDSGVTSLIVADDGVGIAAQDLSRVRARFEQVEEGEGSGLGLSIAETVAENRGGWLDLTSGPDGGLTVCLRFPNAP